MKISKMTAQAIVYAINYQLEQAGLSEVRTARLMAVQLASDIKRIILEEAIEKKDKIKREVAILTNDVEITKIVGPIISKVYGTNGELGHYKVCIESWREGRSGLLIVLGKLGRVKLYSEALENVLQKILNSARPNEKEHPTMFKAWAEARTVLSEEKY